MKVSAIGAVALISCGVVVADDSPASYSDADLIWQNSRSRPEYQTYASEFAQFNNHFHLDTKGGCYSLGSGTVNILMVIAHERGREFATITRVFADVGGEKALCFERTYRNLQTKVPPFSPFVLRLTMQ